MQINLENDVVLGFSAIDLSILKNGFPTVSGWFHIMDFTGKCNGQIKVLYISFIYYLFLFYFIFYFIYLALHKQIFGKT